VRTQRRSLGQPLLPGGEFVYPLLALDVSITQRLDLRAAAAMLEPGTCLPAPSLGVQR